MGSVDDLIFAKGSIHGDIFTKDNREYNASIINVWDKMGCTYSPKIWSQ